MDYYMSCEKEGIRIEQRKKKAHVIVKTLKEYVDFWEQEAKVTGRPVSEFQVMCSSSMDWPEDSTSDKDLQVLALQIRSKAWATLKEAVYLQSAAD